MALAWQVLTAASGAPISEFYAHEASGSLMYKNGSLTGVGRKDFTLHNSPNSYLFSREGSDGYFAGDVGELLVYKRALNSSERQVGRVG